jgi:predicted O-linked N-acetylglucosamine transferase (SPINDLY family)
MLDQLHRLDHLLSNHPLAEPLPPGLCAELDALSAQVQHMYSLMNLLALKRAILQNQYHDVCRIVEEVARILPANLHHALSRLLLSVTDPLKLHSCQEPIQFAFEELVTRFEADAETHDSLSVYYLHLLIMFDDVTAMKRFLSKHPTLKFQLLHQLLFDFIGSMDTSEDVLTEAHRQVLHVKAFLENNQHYPSSFEIRHPHAVYLAPTIMMEMYFEGDSSSAYMKDFGWCWQKLIPALNFRAAFLDQPRRPGKLRVGYCSAYLHSPHSIFHVYERLLLASPDTVDTFVFMTDPPSTDLNQRFVSLLANPVILARTGPFHDIPTVRQQIAGCELDILIYLDGPEHNVLYNLSFSRLARIQGTSIGHCSTSGVPNMDVYISSRLYEPMCADTHYTEKLVLLDHLLTCYAPPIHNDPRYLGTYTNRIVLQLPFLSRKDLGLPTNAVIFACIQNEFKFNARFLRALKRIVTSISHGYVVIKEPGWQCYAAKSRERILAYLGEHVLFVPYQDALHYQSYVHCCDVMLAPFPFGGFCTSLDGVWANKPVVTLEGKKLMGRFTAGFYRTMGFMDCVASTDDEYVQIAIRLATDMPFYRNICEKTMKNKHVLFNHKQSTHEWHECIQQLAATHVTSCLQVPT